MFDNAIPTLMRRQMSTYRNFRRLKYPAYRSRVTGADNPTYLKEGKKDKIRVAVGFGIMFIGLCEAMRTNYKMAYGIKDEE